MQITEQQIEQYQLLYKNRFHSEIPRKEAFEQATLLLRLVELTFKPMAVSDYKSLLERKKRLPELLHSLKYDQRRKIKDHPSAIASSSPINNSLGLCSSKHSP